MALQVPDFMSQYQSDLPPMPSLMSQEKDQKDGGAGGKESTTGIKPPQIFPEGRGAPATDAISTGAYTAPEPGSFAAKAQDAFAGFMNSPFGEAMFGPIAKQSMHNLNPEKIDPVTNTLSFGLSPFGVFSGPIGLPAPAALGLKAVGYGLDKLGITGKRDAPASFGMNPDQGFGIDASLGPAAEALGLGGIAGGLDPGLGQAASDLGLSPGGLDPSLGAAAEALGVDIGGMGGIGEASNSDIGGSEGIGEEGSEGY